jgi:hypothetical protein
MTREQAALLLVLAQTMRAVLFCRDVPSARLLERLDKATAAAFRPEPPVTISPGRSLKDKE